MDPKSNLDFSAPRTSLSDVFLSLNLDNNVRIIDVACGVGIVAEEVKKFGYHNIDGLDPVKGYIKVVEARGIYKVENMSCKIFCYFHSFSYHS